ncbi:MAG: SPFH domain-containing protein [Chloroflexota bacterium]|nr:SPFH domain-containing protein [Chloroflexota bacterium]
MLFVRALPNQYLLAARNGILENRGSAVHVFLKPGTVWLLVPSTKQQATFEFTQESSDGIPLRFKGMVVYRITDPVAAAKVFDFTGEAGPARIGGLLTNICLAELRHAVSHMTMAECIEQRKTTLGAVIRDALEDATHAGDPGQSWGLAIEVAQVAQVFITDGELREQLEAEVRNDIRLRSGQSDTRTDENLQLAELASRDRLDEQKLASERERLRRSEELAAAEAAATQAKMEADAPVTLARIAHERDALERQLEMQPLKNRVGALETEHALQRARAEQDLRREILPLEQAPRVVEAASGVFRGASLSVYDGSNELTKQIAPLLDLAARTVERTLVRAAGNGDAGE